MRARSRDFCCAIVAIVVALAGFADLAAAQDRRCSFYAATETEFVARLAPCQTGDVLSAALAEGLGSPLAYAALVCDFRQQIVTDEVLSVDPGTGEQVHVNVLACVLTGRVRAPVHG